MGSLLIVLRRWWSPGPTLVCVPVVTGRFGLPQSSGAIRTRKQGKRACTLFPWVDCYESLYQRPSEPTSYLVAFLATGFLAAGFLATGFLAGAAFLATGFLAATFLAGAFLAGAAFATGFLAGAFLAGAAFLAGVFLTGIQIPPFRSAVAEKF